MENMNLKPWGRICVPKSKSATRRGLSLLSTCTWSDAIDNVAEAPTVAGGQKLQGNYDVFAF